jgi:katanin p60 ATPase-containing subunit A1
VNPRAKRLDDSQPLPPIPGKGGAGAAASGLDNMAAAGVGIKKLQAAKDEEEELVAFQGRTKALPDFGTKELNEIAQTVYRDILDEDPSVTFDTIAELDAAKRLLKEAVVMPTKYPQLFQGLVRPWKGILLFGPPGTGKTMLAKAVATECHTTFFNMSASTLVSKWRGDSEKLVRMLFDLAVHFAPSTIFLDELDAMLSARGGGGQEHEATRRMKTEFLVQMDGLSKRRNGDIVFVLAASNLPWDLDSAVLRRLEKRIFVPLPSIRGREILLRQNLPHVAPGFDFEKIAGMLQGFSGADVDILCREGTMRTVRLLIDRLERDKDLDDGKEVPKPLVSMSDMVASIAVTRPSAQSVPLRQYVAWEKSFGSTMSLEDGSSAAVSATPRRDAADADDGDEGANT